MHLNYRNYCAIISRALISSPQGGYLVNAARASVNRAIARFILKPARRRRDGSAASKGSSTAPPSPIQSLAKHNRKPAELTENTHQRSKSIASFCPHFSRASTSRLPAEISNRHCRRLEMAATPRKQRSGPILIDTILRARRTLRASQITSHEAQITAHRSRSVCLPSQTLLK